MIIFLIRKINYMIQNDTCYDPSIFMNEHSIEGLICPIGLGVFRNPVFDPCGHVFCHSCITSWLKKSNLCPIGKQPITESQLVKALPLKNMVDNLDLKQCLMKCDWKGKLDMYNQHAIKECQEALVDCTHLDCKKRFPRKDIDSHLAQCEYKMMECQFCKQMTPTKNMNEHLEICDDRLIECQFCRESVKQNDQNHIYNCEARPVQCPIEGCKAEGIQRNEIDKHLSSIDHLILLQNQIKELKLKLQEQDYEIQAAKTSLLPYLEGWQTKFSKKGESREWNQTYTINKMPRYFNLDFEVQNMKHRPNSWRGVIGLSKQKSKQPNTWYREDNYVWILGGLKGSKTGAEKYGSEIEGENIRGSMRLDEKNQLSFFQNGKDMGVAFQLDQNDVNEQFYLIICLINVGKVRLTSLEKL